MLGVEVSAIEQRLFVLPLRLGGLRICNPVSLASHLFSSSFGSTWLDLLLVLSLLG